MAVSLVSTGVTFPDNTTQTTAATGFGFKNRIINGAMVIDQRNAGASVTPTSSAYTLDRWQAVMSQSSKYSVQQNAGSVTPPAGFTKYLGVTSASAYSVLTGDYFTLQQPIEGLNIANLGWGAAGASTVTLSFWVRSSLTGTFGGALQNSGYSRSYPFTYTISAANTWEQKFVTVAGDTSGTWLTDSSAGIRLNFNIGTGTTYSGTAGSWAGANYLSATGATSVVGTSGATFYITGVQLEKGSTATSFDYRPYGTELALCQRYLPAFGGYVGHLAMAQCNSTTAVTSVILFPVPTRVAPTGIIVSSGAHFTVNKADGAGVALTGLTFNDASNTASSLAGTGASGLVAGNAAGFRANSTSANLYFTGCEL